MSERAGRYQRSAAGMAGALLVLVGIVVALVVLQGVGSRPTNPVHPVEYRRTADYARQQAHFDVVAPASLPRGWRATSVSFVPQGRQRWHLGVLTAADRYVGLEQADSSVRSMVRAYVDPSASRGKPVTIGGHTWTTWSDSGGDLAFVRREGHTTTLVVGTARRGALVGYVRSLR